MLRGVHERLILSTVGLPETERLGDRIVSAALSFGVGDRLLDFDDRVCAGECACGSEISFESFKFGDAEPDRFEMYELGDAIDLLFSCESFNGDAVGDLASEPLRLLDLDKPFSGSLLLSGLIGVSILTQKHKHSLSSKQQQHFSIHLK